MSNFPPKMSARTFRNPLLVTLGRMSLFKTGVAISCEDTYLPICQSMGIADINAWGPADNNMPWPQRWIQFAFKDLCDAGHGQRVKKGWWSLTPSGVEAAMLIEAATLIEKNPSVPERQATPSPSPVIPVARPEPPVAQVMEPLEVGVFHSLSLGFGQDRYHVDPMVREVASQSTPCVGNYSDQSPICGDCGIMFSCQNVVATRLIQLASKLDEEDKEEERATLARALALSAMQAESTVPVPVPVAAPVVMEPAAPDATPPKKDLEWVKGPQATANRITNALASRCALCGEVQVVDHTGVWVKEMASGGTAKSRNSALFHVECYEKLTGKKAPT